MANLETLQLKARQELSVQRYILNIVAQDVQKITDGYVDDVLRLCLAGMMFPEGWIEGEGENKKLAYDLGVVRIGASQRQDPQTVQKAEAYLVDKYGAGNEWKAPPIDRAFKIYEELVEFFGEHINEILEAAAKPLPEPVEKAIV